MVLQSRWLVNAGERSAAVPAWHLVGQVQLQIPRVEPQRHGSSSLPVSNLTSLELVWGPGKPFPFWPQFPLQRGWETRRDRPQETRELSKASVLAWLWDSDLKSLLFCLMNSSDTRTHGTECPLGLSHPPSQVAFIVLPGNFLWCLEPPGSWERSPVLSSSLPSHPMP